MRSAIIGQFVFAAFVIALWEVVTKLGFVDPTLLPPFSTVFAILIHLLGSPSFIRDLGVTASEVAVAVILAAPLAVAFGFLLGHKPKFGAKFTPVLFLALAIPQSIFLPIFVLAFGNGFFEKVLFGFTHAFFVIALNALAAVQSVPARLVSAARSFGASSSQIFRHIYVPAMLPLLVDGLRLGIIFAIIGVILAEMYASRAGIGKAIFGWGEAYQVPELMAGVLLVSILTIALNETMRFLESRVS